MFPSAAANWTAPGHLPVRYENPAGISHDPAVRKDERPANDTLASQIFNDLHDRRHLDRQTQEPATEHIILPPPQPHTAPQNTRALPRNPSPAAHETHA